MGLVEFLVNIVMLSEMRASVHSRVEPYQHYWQAIIENFLFFKTT
jgi:hypothetical protein